MLIDWFTVIAQIINFLILVALLKYFLYGRIIKAMDQREEKIAARLAQAEEREEEADKELHLYQGKVEELEGQRADLLSQAREDADSERKKLLDQAREEVEDTKSRWYAAIDREKVSFLQDLRERASQQIFAIARRALGDLANADLEQQMVEAFARRLAELTPERRQELGEALETGGEVVVTSAFPLPEAAQGEITRNLHQYVTHDVAIRYHLAPEVISGIEVKVPGHKIAWSLDNYLTDLEGEIRGALEERAAL